jgi:2-(1,2-epoxy-1,2-dihydrophenyl)acetyl-CoA isomerase
MQTLTYELRGNVAAVTLNRPEARNALNAAMAQELGDLLARLRVDEEVRVILLCGAGGAFCSGGDVKSMGEGRNRSLEQRRANFQVFQRVAVELLAMDKPVVAAAQGVAFGAGLSLLLLCDLVLLSSDARMSMVFQRIGLVPDLAAMYTLPRAVGLQRAKELVFSAREITAAEALALGIATEVLAATELAPRAEQVAQALAGASPVALALAKRGLGVSLQSDAATMLELEASAQAIAGGSAYVQEAARRFAAKEAPQFRWPAR